jgi:hypothetical protein
MMPPTKDNPLEPERPGWRDGNVTLWLEREGMAEARENFWQAFAAIPDVYDTRNERRTWQIAWAAAIAAFSYLMEGRISPKS